MSAHDAPVARHANHAPFDAVPAVANLRAPTRNRRHPAGHRRSCGWSPSSDQAVAVSAAVAGSCAASVLAAPFPFFVGRFGGVVSCPSVFQNLGPLTAG